jgi:hypothetical protein
MAKVPARSGGRNRTLTDPCREFEDICGCMAQLVNVALGELGTAWRADVPRSPSAEISETESAWVVVVELSGAPTAGSGPAARDRGQQLTAIR